MAWFRFYEETYKEDRIRDLPPAQRWLWAVVLSLASESRVRGKLLKYGDIPLTVTDLAQAAKIEESEVKAGIRAFLKPDERGHTMVHREGSVLVVTNWHKRQYASDVSTGRVQKHRDRLKANSTHPAGSETFHETDQKQSRTESEAEADSCRSAFAQDGGCSSPQGSAEPLHSDSMDTCGIPFEQYGTLRRTYSHAEIAAAKSEVDSRPNSRSLSRWDRYLPSVIDDLRTRKPRTNPNGGTHPPKAARSSNAEFVQSLVDDGVL